MIFGIYKHQISWVFFMSVILSDIPFEITAGDSVTWDKSFSNYPADDGWVISYALVKGDNQITFNGGASGAVHRVALGATDTNGWDAGVYSYQVKLTKGDDKVTVESGTVTIVADYSAATAGLDARTHFFKMRDALRALSEGKATDDQLSLSINNRSISKMAPSEVLEWLNHYEALCMNEMRKERARRGKSTGQIVKARFTGF
jgi:hypothetical protein